MWRAALRFPLTTIPSGSAVVSATLHLSFDGVCLGPRKTKRPCAAARGSFWTEGWQRLSFDVSDQVIEWVEYGAANDGLLLKLADGEEDFGAGGPRLPAAELADPAPRPLLEVTYMPA